MARKQPDIEDLYRLAEGELDAGQAAELLRWIETSDETRAQWEAIKEQSGFLGLLKEHREALPVDDSDSVIRDLPALPPGYRYDAMVRRGGQAVVYRAIQESTERVVAIKIIPDDDHAPNAALRLEREYEFIRRLQHPNIVRLYDSGQIAGNRFLVMEFIEGRHLDVWMEDERPPLTDRVRLVAKLSRAVHFAHQRGIIHRDLKPSNIIIDLQGEPHILDFGIAKPTLDARELREVTKTGEFAGTLPYASPEQLQGDPDLVDVRTDVHALGLLLFECLTLEHVWRDHVSIAQLIRAITEETARPPSSVNGQVDTDLDAIVACALAKDADRRYASAEALERDLNRWSSGDAVEARGAGGWYLLRKVIAKNWLFATAVAALFLVLCVATIVCWSFWKEQEAQTQRARRAEDAVKREKEQLDRTLHERMQLSDILKLRRLLERQRDLWPVGPDLERPCNQWIEEAIELQRNQAAHGHALRRLRQRARPYSEEEKQRGYPEEYAQLRIVERQLAQIDPEDVEARESLEAAREELLAVIETRLYWSYDDPDDAWFEEKLGELIDLLVELEGAYSSVVDRLERSRSLVARTIDGERAAWDRCLASLNSDQRFAGVNLAPVPGLVPLGKDRTAGLWAFWHAESGDRPAFDEERGRWVPGPDGGLVLLLVPQGSFRMGATPPRRVESPGPNEDPWADADCQPVHDVALSAFFVSQYEMTRAQWQRFIRRERGEDRFGAGPRAEDPVEYVSWHEVARVLESLALEIPTEAQWEYVARAGASTAFPSGSTIASLQGYANIFDAGSHDNANDRHLATPTPDFSDGFERAAPIGSFKPNAWGLYDVIGNAAEWCRDAPHLYKLEAREGDGLRSSLEGRSQRVYRGGSFLLAAPFCTSAQRQYADASERIQSLGVRPSLALRMR